MKKIILYIYLTSYIVLLTILSGCTVSGNDNNSFNNNQTIESIKKSAWFCLEGETSCLVVSRTSAQKSESLIYRYMDDNKIDWVQAEIVETVSFTNNTNNNDYGIIKVVRGVGCNDYFAIGSIYLDSTTILEISDNCDSTYYVSHTTEDHPEYKVQMFDVYCVLKDINGLDININGNILSMN